MVHKASFKLLAWATTAHAIVIEPFEASYVSPPWDTWCLVTVLSALSKVDMPHAGHLQLMVLITCGGGTSVSPTGPSQPGYVQTQQSVSTQTVCTQGTYRRSSLCLHRLSTEHWMSTFWVLEMWSALKRWGAWLSALWERQIAAQQCHQDSKCLEIHWLEAFEASCKSPNSRWKDLAHF